jgi:transmembrane sensor
MINDRSRLQYLLTRYTENNCTREELLELFTMIKNAGDDEVLHQYLEPVWQSITAGDKMPELDRNKIYQNIVAGNVVHQMHAPRRWMRYAAAVILLASGTIGTYLFVKAPKTIPIGTYAKNSVIKQDRKSATLTLADGSHIMLNNKSAGIITTQNNVPVNQIAHGEIAYQLNTAKPSKAQAYNALVTPLGGQFA